MAPTSTQTEEPTSKQLANHRSEIYFLVTAKQSNPNGDPLSPDNRPRIDPVTGELIVTDVRLKRYLRDQLHDDGHGVYIVSGRTDDGFARTRSDLVKQCLDIDDVDDVDDDIVDELLATAVDIRMFGALLSLKSKNVDDVSKAIADALPPRFEGPIQFSPARSLHPVSLNEESSSLTSVIATKDGKETGGYGLKDYRVRFAAFGWHGVVNENTAANTWLTETDVQRLDTLMWRSIKNQARSRSKTGQEPRMYIRVEYNEDHYHAGIDDLVTISDEFGGPVDELRSIRDVTFNMDDLLACLENNQDRIETVHVNMCDQATIDVDGVIGGPELFFDSLNDVLSEDQIHVIDVYEEYTETRPN